MKAFILRYRLYQIPFWFAYGYIWWVCYDGDPVGNLRSIFTTPYAVKFFAYMLGEMGAVWFNLYFLMPRLLEKGRVALYATLLVASAFAFTALVMPGYWITAALYGRNVKDVFGGDFTFWHQYWTTSFPAVVAAMTLGMSIKMTQHWIRAKQRQQLLEKEKLETELTFLKNQFNPHFLFNTINSIFFLIHKNPSMASDSLAKFSDLLRYQLYECNDQQIPLASELTYIQNFVELERLRQNENVRVDLHLDRDRDGRLGVAPFVLMTFVENAFKHVSKHREGGNWIEASLMLDGPQLDFSVVNSVSGSATREVVHYGGIGLRNVRRRLDLLYPGQYELDILNDGSAFSVRLRLRLSELAGLPRAAAQTVSS